MGGEREWDGWGWGGRGMELMGVGVGGSFYYNRAVTGDLRIQEVGLQMRCHFFLRNKTP